MTESQFSTFKDSIARRLLRSPESASAAQDDASSLDEFVEYLANEAWPTLPQSLKEATYENKATVPDADDISLESTSTAFIDTLISYGITSDSEDSIKVLRKSIADYIEEACAPPPVWVSTRTTECEICFREGPLTYHHLIPRSTHARVLKKGWHPKHMLNTVAWLCRNCHSTVHKVTTNEDLAQNFYTVELLLQREDIQKWQKYASKQRFGSRRRPQPRQPPLEE